MLAGSTLREINVPDHPASASAFIKELISKSHISPNNQE
jgi:hypothetical protein